MTLDDAAEPLDNLRFNWGSAYRIHFFEPDKWVAQRRDTHDSLKSDTPLGLRDLILEDYTERPVVTAALPR
jgi:hypothetical protein